MTQRVCPVCRTAEADPPAPSCRYCGSPMPVAAPADAPQQQAGSAPDQQPAAAASLPAAGRGSVVFEDDVWARPATRLEVAAPSGLRLTNPVLELRFDGRDIPLGRAADSPVAGHPAINDYVSSRHAVISFVGGDSGRPFITDVGSTNGTLVNGAPLAARQPRELQVGDRIQLTRMNPVAIEVI